MLLSNINVFVTIEDAHVRNYVMELFKKFSFIDNLEPLKFTDLRKFPIDNGLSYVFIDHYTLKLTKEVIFDLKMASGENLQIILLLTEPDQCAETYKKGNIFDYIFPDGEFDKIEQIFNGHTSNKSVAIPPDEDIGLNEYEKKILLLICNQYSCKEIGEKLFLGTRTVENYRYKLLLKTKSKNTAGLVIFAIKNGLYNVQ